MGTEGTPAGKARFGLPKDARLLKRAEFLRLSRRGRRMHSAHFILCYGPAPGHRSRIGITVTRKVGGAVQRNRIKRVCREAFRRNRVRDEGAWDLNLIAKKQAAAGDNAALRASLEYLFNALLRKGGDEGDRPDNH